MLKDTIFAQDEDTLTNDPIEEDEEETPSTEETPEEEGADEEETF